MNQIENNLKQALHNAVQKAFDTELDTASIVIEIPKDKSHGDYSTNVAMQLTRVLKNNPRKIAEAVVEALDKAAADIESCEIAGPGFINFTIKKALRLSSPPPCRSALRLGNWPIRHRRSADRKSVV